MSNKYYARGNSIISRDESSFERGEKMPSWFDDYVSILEKQSVKSKEDDYSIFNQISDIIGGKSKYSTVDEAVEDMQRRTGLYGVLQRKRASNNAPSNVKLFQEHPILKTYIDNYIEDRPGVAMEVVVYDILKLKPVADVLPNPSDVPAEVKKYINDKINEVNKFNVSKEHTNADLGKLDITEDTGVVDDPLAACMPKGK